MENQAIIESFSEFKDEKNIDRVTLMAIIEEAFRNQLLKKYGTDENFDIIVNPDKGDLEIWQNRVIVADGEVEEDNLEIELTSALKIEPDFEPGGKYEKFYALYEAAATIFYTPGKVNKANTIKPQITHKIRSAMPPTLPLCKACNQPFMLFAGPCFHAENILMICPEWASTCTNVLGKR